MGCKKYKNKKYSYDDKDPFDRTMIFDDPKLLSRKGVKQMKKLKRKKLL